ncbi:MAG: succinate dehydrogenase assembly factor 2 [Acetobacteraceae bacterium]
MTDVPLPRDPRRRRILYRATHRGTVECDHLIGGFVARRVSGMLDSELAELEALLALPDPDLLAWVSGRQPIPAEHDGPVIRAMREASR